MFKILLITLFAAGLLYPQQQVDIPWPTLTDSPWPMVKHNPQGTGRSPYVGPKAPNVLWTMNMEYGILSGPIIGPEGFLYVGTNTWLPLDTTNYFYSINPNGTLRWTFYTGETFSTDSGFLIDVDSTIYFGSQAGYIYSVDIYGKLRWKYDFGMNIFSHVMNTDKDSSIYVSSADGNLYSVNRGNGSINWKASYDGDFRASSPIFSPDGHTIYIAGHDSNMYALNLDGSLKWKFSCGTASIVPAVDNEGNIYFTTKTDSFGLHSIYPNGEVRWTYNFDNYNANRNNHSPTIDKNGNIYFPAHYFWGEVSIISVDYNGNFRWEYNFEQEDELIVVPLICDADGTIYCGSSWGYYYYAISSEGDLIWKLPLDGYQVDNSGAIDSDGTLYIGTHLGSLTTGQERTLIAIRDTVTSVVSENYRIIGYSLSQNYPNPFNPTTTIKFTIPTPLSPPFNKGGKTGGLITLKVYDVLGNEIATLVNEEKLAGSYEVEFSAYGGAGELVSGIYFYQLQAGDPSTGSGQVFIETKKMLLLK